MTDHDGFFQEKQPAAVLKHAMLREYTKVFASMVGSRNPAQPIWVIDGYAGAGAYEAPHPEQDNPDGSPLVVLKMAAGFRQRDIRCLFIEQDSVIATALRSNIAPFRKRGTQVEVLEGSVESQLPIAWDTVGRDPVVTFLDPFGVALDRKHMTDTLLARRPNAGPSEVLLNINVQAVGRLGGNLQRSPRGVVAKPGQERGVEKADAFLGGPWWRQTFLDARLGGGLSPSEAARQVVDEYRSQVCAPSGRHSMSIPIRRRPGHLPLFLLTLFYEHSAAGFKFADAACRATRKWRDAYRRRELEDFLDRHSEESLFGDDFEREEHQREGRKQEADLDEAWVGAICQNVREARAPRLGLAQDVVVILGDTLGLAGERHIKRAWDRLSDEGLLRPRDKAQKALHRAVMQRA